MIELAMIPVLYEICLTCCTSASHLAWTHRVMGVELIDLKLSRLCLKHY